jgi:hypothetical protein
MTIRLSERSKIVREITPDVIRSLPKQQRAMVLAKVAAELGREGLAKRFARENVKEQVKDIIAEAKGKGRDDLDYIGRCCAYALDMAEKAGLDFDDVKGVLEVFLKNCSIEGFYSDLDRCFENFHHKFGSNPAYAPAFTEAFLPAITARIDEDKYGDQGYAVIARLGYLHSALPQGQASAVVGKMVSLMIEKGTFFLLRNISGELADEGLRAKATALSKCLYEDK